MALIKCPECGSEVSEQAASCPKCGYPIREYVDQLKAGNPQPTNLAALHAANLDNSPSAQTKEGKKRAGCTILTVSLLIVALAAFAGWYLFFRGGNDTDERVAYNTITRYAQENNVDSLGEALNVYFDTYNSDAYHFSQLKELSDRFFTEQADWQTADGQNTKDAFRHFLDLHPDGFFRTQAQERMESFVYEEAIAANTREKYEQYLRQFPMGRHIEEIQKKLSDLDKQEVTVEEKVSIKGTLQNHFDAIASNDKDAISATLARKISSYIGKTDATEEDIYAYMDRVSSSNRVIVFDVKDTQIAKVEIAGRSMYNVQFSLDEATYTADVTALLNTDGEESEEKPVPSSVKHFSGTAVLNESMKITSLVLKQ